MLKNNIFFFLIATIGLSIFGLLSWQFIQLTAIRSRFSYANRINTLVETRADANWWMGSQTWDISQTDAALDSLIGQSGIAENYLIGALRTNDLIKWIIIAAISIFTTLVIGLLTVRNGIRVIYLPATATFTSWRVFLAWLFLIPIASFAAIPRSFDPSGAYWLTGWRAGPSQAMQIGIVLFSVILVLPTLIRFIHTSWGDHCNKHGICKNCAYPISSESKRVPCSECGLTSESISGFIPLIKIRVRYYSFSKIVFSFLLGCLLVFTFTDNQIKNWFLLKPPSNTARITYLTAELSQPFAIIFSDWTTVLIIDRLDDNQLQGRWALVSPAESPTAVADLPKLFRGIEPLCFANNVWTIPVFDGRVAHLSRIPGTLPRFRVKVADADLIVRLPSSAELVGESVRSAPLNTVGDPNRNSRVD